MSINLNRVGLRISAGQPNQFPAAPVPQVAFSGRSNVGKSSLVNCLLGRKSLARVSSAPGKTVTVNFYDIDGKLFFVDLPGYGFAKRRPEEREQWSALTDAMECLGIAWDGIPHSSIADTIACMKVWEALFPHYYDC